MTFFKNSSLALSVHASSPSQLRLIQMWLLIEVKEGNG